MQTAWDLVWLQAERTPDQLALVDDLSARALTYRELLAETDAVAAGLQQRGIAPGQRVATALPTVFEHCVALLALARLGAVPALMNLRLTPADLAALVGQGKLAGAIVAAQPELAAAVRAALPERAPLLTVGGSVPGAEDFAACRAGAAGLPPVPRPGREDPAFIFYTSGTTGLPKGVVLAHRTTEARVVWLSTQAGLRHGTHNRALGFMPLSHAIGFYGVFLTTLAYGGTYYVMSRFDPAKAVELIERHRITYLFAIPPIYVAMAAAPNYAPARMASLELALYGGSPIEPALLQAMHDDWGGTVRHIYGTTETMCSLYNPEPLSAPATLRPGFFSRVRAIRFGGAPDERVAPGEEGELIIDASAEAVFSGYLDRPDATAEKLRDGWYYSGDIVRLEPNGDLTLYGRVDDMIRSGGESVYPEEVEAVLARHPGVAECSVVGVPDARWGYIVVGCVVARGAAPAAAALDEHCRAAGLAAYKCPKAYVALGALPKNAIGKVLRRLLREAAAAARDGKGEARFEPVARA